MTIAASKRPCSLEHVAAPAKCKGLTWIRRGVVITILLCLSGCKSKSVDVTATIEKATGPTPVLPASTEKPIVDEDPFKQIKDDASHAISDFFVEQTLNGISYLVDEHGDEILEQSANALSYAIEECLRSALEEDYETSDQKVELPTEPEEDKHWTQSGMEYLESMLGK